MGGGGGGRGRERERVREFAVKRKWDMNETGDFNDSERDCGRKFVMQSVIDGQEPQAEDP